MLARKNMRYAPASQRGILCICIALILLTLSARLSSQNDRGSAILLPPTKQQACHIWPDRDYSSPPEQLFYDEVDTTTRALVGDAAAIGRPDQCLLAGSRLSQYHQPLSGHSWTEVQWGRIQERCAAKTDRTSENEYNVHQIWRQPPLTSPEAIKFPTGDAANSPRTAVVVRTWDNYNYTENRLSWLRTLIAETSLHSKGVYRVFFVVNVKDNDLQLEEDPDAYARTLHQCVPEEFRDMAVLYNQRTLEKWYPKVQEHGAQDQMYQALQIFSTQFPEFSHFWQLELDLRLTGHIHTTLESATSFARAQPRRNLWERNGRFYIPSLYGHSYETFSDAVDHEMGGAGVWGPVPTTDFEPKGPQPPPRAQLDWGVGEDADLIGFMPMIDPVGTQWIYEDRVNGFVDNLATPRRAAFVSITRTSRRLLQLISEAQRERGQWVVSEATPETFALLHGLKAVTVPHPITFATDDMTPQKLDAEINRGPLHSKAGGKAPSFSYTINGFVSGPWAESSYWWTGSDASNIWKEYIAGKCLGPMLLHPVKDE